VQKMSTNTIEYVARVDKKTVWKLLVKVSGIPVSRYYEATEVIGGKDIIAEIDESKFGKRKYNKGHKVGASGTSVWFSVSTDAG
jgi:hypothetical protein